MPIANLFATTLGFVLAAIGVLGLAAPAVLVELGRSLQSSGGLYVVAAIRVVFGAILIWAAPNSRTPRILLLLGIFIIIAGVLTPFFGVERSHAMFDWWFSEGAFFTRALPMLAVGLGLFIAYAASSPGRSAI